jgi:rhamnulose-1-phosphate aldolase/alcohol dehydrogenase
VDNRWSDSDTVGMDDVDLLVYQSRLMGAEPKLVLWGGGNTSFKLDEEDYRGISGRVLRIKGSGSDMKSIERKHFPGIRMDDLLPLFEREEMSDDEMVRYLASGLMEPDSPRPSIETLLHAFLPHNSVAHSHADAILSLTNNVRAKEILGTLYGKEVALVPYRRPGFTLSKEVGWAAKRSPLAKGVVLLNHGLITWGGTAKEAYDTHVEMVSKAEEFTARHAAGKLVFGGVKQKWLDPDTRRYIAGAVAPTLRGLVSQDRRMLLRFDDSKEVLDLASSQRGKELSGIGPATPDHLIQTKQLPLWLDVSDPSDLPQVLGALHQSVEEYKQRYSAWFAEYRADGVTMLDPYPRVVLLPGVGMWTTGRDMRATRVTGDIYSHTIGIISEAQAVGDYVTLAPQDVYDAEYWPLELYKLTLAPPEKELARRVALVTGAASGIGRAIARRLAAEGAHVVVTDVDADGAQKVADDLVASHGAERAVACAMDVTNEDAVADAFRHARLTYGGLDVVVSNAGIATVGLVQELSVDEWRRSLDINATGHFLVAREAVKLLRQQNIGGSIVFVGTKNVPSPGKEFGAYSASKAAEAQLARVLAIENGEYGIRANIINPDAVFRDSNLWSPQIRAQRAAAHGIPEAEMEEFYRQRNLLHVSVTAEDVAEAAFLFASDRTAKTTGAMLPVDGGLRDAFPR